VNLSSLPNLLTAARIVAVPLVVMLFYWGHPWSNRWPPSCSSSRRSRTRSMAISRAAWASRRDGRVSRSRGGQADVATALVLLVGHDTRPFIVVTAIVIIGREITVSALREWMAHLGARAKVAVSASASGRRSCR